MTGVSGRKSYDLGCKSEKLWYMNFFYNFLFYYFLFVLYSFMFLEFTHLNPKDFPLPQVHFCSSLFLSIYLHSLPFNLIGFVTINGLYISTLLLPSHPKVFFQDFFSKKALLCLFFCELFLERCFTVAIDIYSNF